MTVRLWTIYRLDWVRIAIPITLQDGQSFRLSTCGQWLYSTDPDGALWIAPTRSANDYPVCPPDWRTTTTTQESHQ